MLFALPFALTLWEMVLCLISKLLINNTGFQSSQWKGAEIVVRRASSSYHCYRSEAKAVDLSLRGHEKIICVYCHQPVCGWWRDEYKSTTGYCLYISNAGCYLGPSAVVSNWHIGRLLLPLCPGLISYILSIALERLLRVGLLAGI